MNNEIYYHLLNSSVVVSISGKPFTIAKGDKRYEAVVKAIKENRLSDLPVLVDLKLTLKKVGMDYEDGVVKHEEENMPDGLHRKIVELTTGDLPVDILKKFWDNLKQNPSFNSKKMLYQFLEHNGHPLTQDGCFIAYRGVTDDLKDPRTKTFDNSPGSICEMPREQVDDNPNNTCSAGLHVACYDYAKGFASKLVEVKVNPKDVVAVPVDYNGTKMRVSRFEVIRMCEGMLEESVYSGENEEEMEAPESQNEKRYLVREKGDTTWTEVYANSPKEAAKKYSDDVPYDLTTHTVNVREGNTYHKVTL